MNALKPRPAACAGRRPSLQGVGGPFWRDHREEPAAPEVLMAIAGSLAIPVMGPMTAACRERGVPFIDPSQVRDQAEHGAGRLDQCTGKAVASGWPVAIAMASRSRAFTAEIVPAIMAPRAWRSISVPGTA
jgi:hypothetical protein